MDTNPHALEPSLPHPFHFTFSSALTEEMCLDDFFAERPRNAEEAIAIGKIYPKRFNPQAAMESVESILSGYGGLPNRILLAGCRLRGHTAPSVLIYLGGKDNLRVMTDPVGLYGQLYIKASRLVAAKGFRPDWIQTQFFGLPLSNHATAMHMASWVIGFDRVSGFSAILDNSVRPSPAIRAFFGNQPQRTLDLDKFRPTGRP
jgi:hypothetical protein